MANIPVTVLTGFLGSGKTTLLNRALRDPQLKGTVVIVNEFGEIGLDHELIEASSDSVVLLQNGCLCCSVRGDLVETLIDLHQKRLKGEIPEFDHVVIETSGLAEPTPVTEVLVAAPGVKSCFSLAGIVTTVDAVNGLATLDAHEQSVKQIALADRIVMTKSDLLTRPDELRERLARLNPACEVLDAREVDAGALMRFVASNRQEPAWRVVAAQQGERQVHGGSSQGEAHGHDARIKRFTIVRDEPWDLETLKLLLEALATNAGPALLRVKGLIHMQDSPERPAVIHGAQQLVHSLSWLDRWPSEDRRTRIVFITMDQGAEEIGELVEDIERLSQRTRAVRERAANHTGAVTGGANR
uniref:GTP-binding protein n=3 Tax=Aromatoleum TaxID=551759 RepID=A0N0U9_9RHOO|nr:p47k family protein [Aromatoleum anaerobium]